MAFSGGARYSPTTSVTLPTGSGPVEDLNDSDGHGWTPCSRQARATMAALTVSRAAGSRQPAAATTGA